MRQQDSLGIHCHLRRFVIPPERTQHIGMRAKALD